MTIKIPLWARHGSWAHLIAPCLLMASVALVVGAIIYKPAERPGAPPVTGPASPTPSGPRLIAIAPYRDFGVVPNGSRLQHDFGITNVADVPVAVSVGKTSCNCTQAVLKDDVLGPGQATHLTVRLDAVHSDHSQSVVSEVELVAHLVSKGSQVERRSDVAIQEETVAVKASPTISLGLEPATVSFGVVRRGEGESKKEFTVRLPPGAQMTGWSTNAKTKAIQLRVEESLEGGCRVYHGIASVDPDKAPPDSTLFKSELVIDYKGQDGVGSLVLPVTGKFQDLISAEPDVVVWSAGQYDQIKRLSLVGPRDQPITLQSVSGDTVLVSWTIRDNGSNLPVLEVKCVAPAGKKQAMAHGEIRVKCRLRDATRECTVRIPIVVM